MAKAIASTRKNAGTITSPDGAERSRPLRVAIETPMKLAAKAATYGSFCIEAGTHGAATPTPISGTATTKGKANG